MIRKAKEEALDEAKKDLDSMANQENDRYKQLLAEKKMVEGLLVKVQYGECLPEIEFN